MAYRFLHRPSWPRAIALEVSCGLVTLSRSELILTLPFIIAPMAVAAREIEWRKRLSRVGVALLAAGVVPSPWLVHNARRFEEPVYLSTNSSATIAAANCDATYNGNFVGFKDYACADAAFVEAERRNASWDAFDDSQRENAVRVVAWEYIARMLGTSRPSSRRVPAGSQVCLAHSKRSDTTISC